MLSCLTNIKILVHKTVPQRAAWADDEGWQTVCLCFQTHNLGKKLTVGISRQLQCALLNPSSFVTPEIWDISANSLLWVLLHEMWFSADTVSSWWKGPQVIPKKKEAWAGGRGRRVRSPSCISAGLCFWIQAAGSWRLSCSQQQRSVYLSLSSLMEMLVVDVCTLTLQTDILQ